MTELLVVVAIIALLVAILMPALNHAREQARKAVCSTNLQSHGKAIAAYVAANHSYPDFSPWDKIITTTDPAGIYPGNEGWPKFYGVMAMNGIKGRVKTNLGVDYYDRALYGELWSGSFCPSMDAPALIDVATKAAQYGFDSNPLSWTAFHKQAMGYQWSVWLRARYWWSGDYGGQTPWGGGSAPPSLARDNYLDGTYKLSDGMYNIWLWSAGGVTLNNGNHYFAQARRPDEVDRTEYVAEAWDSWDLNSAPKIDWVGRIQYKNEMTPGWTCGPYHPNARGMFNGARHNSCPNILYVDGHGAADATVKVPEDQSGLTGVEADGFNAYTYDNYDATWGTMGHFLPRMRFQEP